MKIEKNKLYKTRNGSMVIIDNVDAKAPKFNIFGCYFEDNKWVSTSWTMEGSYTLNKDTDSPRDITCEWHNQLEDLELKFAI